MSSSMASTEENHENVISITTMTPEEVVANWAHENMINSGAVEKLCAVLHSTTHILLYI